MRKFPALMTVVALLLAACSHLMPEEGPGVTKGSTRFVLVSVSGTTISLFPDPVLIGASNGVVKWSFDNDAPDHRFPEDAVTFPEPPEAPPPSAACKAVATAAEADRRFNNCAPKQHGKEFHCNSVGAAPAQGTCYYYELKVEPKGGGTPIVLDPWAKNE